MLPSSIVAEDLYIKSYGHSNFLIEGDGKSIILNPYKSVGCASNLKTAKFSGADFILASSRLADEGYNPSDLLCLLILVLISTKKFFFRVYLLHMIGMEEEGLEWQQFGLGPKVI